MLSKGKILIALVVAVAAVGLVFASPAVAKVEGDTIVFGAAVSFTGKYSTNGKHTKNGYDLAIKRLNEMGGVKVGNKTYKVKIKYYDDESTPARAGQLADRLIKQDPNNPYFYELKGQALLESGNAKAAIAPLTKSVSLARNAGLIRILLAHAQLESGQKSLLPAAIENLKKGLAQEPRASVGYRHLATAYARQGKVGQAEHPTAQWHQIDGRQKTTQIHAKRAHVKMKRGSP